ncbi:hypothetical protein, conserved [Eimeria praecox]|uniref:Uncharacterized protein n=1 Tax=Eimeria praecox TaxID=51316 RepID=U6GYN0_9EIME|nr:hypothetical protein, conserved [Eimeria praecox]
MLDGYRVGYPATSKAGAEEVRVRAELKACGEWHMGLTLIDELQHTQATGGAFRDAQGTGYMCGGLCMVFVGHTAASVCDVGLLSVRVGYPATSKEGAEEGLTLIDELQHTQATGGACKDAQGTGYMCGGLCVVVVGYSTARGSKRSSAGGACKDAHGTGYMCGGLCVVVVGYSTASVCDAGLLSVRVGYPATSKESAEEVRVRAELKASGGNHMVDG